MAKAKRTVLYSSAGKKLYAVRDKSGQFKDIQQYSRAHRADIKRGSAPESRMAAEKAARAAAGGAKKSVATKSVAKKTAKKAVARKTTKTKKK